MGEENEPGAVSPSDLSGAPDDDIDDPDDRSDPPRVLLLLPSSTYKASDFLAAARELGVRVTVGSEERQALETLTPSTTVTVDFRDPDDAVETIVEFAREYPLRAIVGADDETTVVAARASRRLGLPHNPPDAVARTRDKHALRSTLADSGLPGPGYRLFDVDEPPDEAAAGVPYPCVLKPTFMSASRGVLRADDPEGFVEAFRRIRELLRRPENREAGGDAAEVILVEEYVPGEEYAVEGLLSDGDLQVLALFDKPDPLVGPTFEETIYVTPSRAPEPLQASVRQTVARAAEALGLVHGPIHAEARVDGDRVHVIDVAARTIGGLCARALRFGAGISLEELVLRQAVDRDWSFEREAAAAGVLMLPIPRRGRLEAVDGVETARAQEGIEEVQITIPRTQEVVPLPEGDRYLGFVFARADSPSEVEAALRRAQETLDVRIEPAP